MCDDDGKAITSAVNALRRIEAWAAYTEDHEGDPWRQGYEEAHRELRGYLRSLRVKALIVQLSGNQPTVRGADLTA
jgi:hypothetical protein